MNKLLLLLVLAFALTACEKTPVSVYQGYIEGEWLYLSTPTGGYLETLHVTRGSHPGQGEPAFTLSGDQSSPRSKNRTAALAAQLQAAEAALGLATAQLKRQEELAAQHFASAARTDELVSARTQAAAQVRMLREQLTNNSVYIPEPGEITEIYYRPGEWVPPGQPVLSLLPDDKRHIRFFVPETLVATLRIGQAVEANCDGCTTPISATIDFIAARAEYTPPVIYSQGSREKLVFRVEASPAPQDAARLHPGLPVGISIK